MRGGPPVTGGGRRPRPVRRQADKGHFSKETGMRIVLGILGGALAGGFLGYLSGVYLTCEGSPVQLFDGGNLCGLFGVFLTGPLGAVGGGVAGGLVARRGRQRARDV